MRAVQDDDLEYSYNDGLVLFRTTDGDTSDTVIIVSPTREIYQFGQDY